VPSRVRAASAALACAWLALPARAGEALADPTAPPPPAAADPSPLASDAVEPARALQLQSVLISGERRIAVIDGERVRVGDRVAGAEVVAIEPSEVWLESAAGGIRLPLRRARVKARADSAGSEEGSR